MAATVDVQIPPVLIPVFTGEADVRGAYGGRGSGKTMTFAKMTAIRAYMWDQAGREGVIVCGREYLNSIDDSSLAEVKAAIESEPWLAPHFDIGEKRQEMDFETAAKLAGSRFVVLKNGLARLHRARGSPHAGRWRDGAVCAGGCGS